MQEQWGVSRWKQLMNIVRQIFPEGATVIPELQEAIAPLIKSYSKVEECDATVLNRNAKAGNKKKKFKLIIHEKNK